MLATQVRKMRQRTRVRVVRAGRDLPLLLRGLAEGRPSQRNRRALDHAPHAFAVADWNRSHTFDEQSDSHPAAHTESSETTFCIAFLHLVQEGGGNSHAGAANWMA